MTVSTRSSVADHIRHVAMHRVTAFQAASAKAAVPAALTNDPDYSSLLELDGAYAFRSAVEKRVLPAIIEAWRIPFRVPFAIQSADAAGYWVAEGAPIPVSGFATEGVQVLPLKVGTIIVLSNEMLTQSNAVTDALLIRVVSRGLAAAVNGTFLSPTAAGSGAPAGILDGAFTIPSSGTSAAQLTDDLGALIEAADAADVDLTQAVWLMSPAKAAQIALTLNLDTLGLRGGELLKAPVFTDPAGGSDVVLLAADRMAYSIGMPEVEFASATTLQMLDNPTNNSATPTATAMVSMFQSDSRAVKGTLPVNWVLAEDAVFAITDAEGS